jgi:cytochrome c oxidase cbb3-type subunit 3
MYLPCRDNKLVRRCTTMMMLAGAFLLALAGCHREARQFQPSAQHDTSSPTEQRMSELVSGPLTPAAREQKQHEYEENAYQVSEGKRLYSWFNCTGCHGHGGGDIGPALMDDKWIYGGEIDEIYATIAQGRPNGMPSFAAKLPSEQIWQLAAYVRTMSGHGPKAVRPGRDDDLQIPAEQGRRELPTLPVAPADSGKG